MIETEQITLIPGDDFLAFYKRVPPETDLEIRYRYGIFPLGTLGTVRVYTDINNVATYHIFTDDGGHASGRTMNEGDAALQRATGKLADVTTELQVHGVSSL